MFNTKRLKQHASSQPHGTHRQLFADYPYPILTELNKAYEQRQKSSASPTLVSSKWYRDSFRKLIAVLHDRRSHDSSTEIVEQSFRSITLSCNPSEEIYSDEGTQTISIRL